MQLTADQGRAVRRYFDRLIGATAEGKPAIEQALDQFLEFGDTGRLTGA